MIFPSKLPPLPRPHPFPVRVGFSFFGIVEYDENMRIVRFDCPTGTTPIAQCIRKLWVKAMNMSEETGFWVRAVVDEDETVCGFALFSDHSLISALALEDCIEDLWSLFDAMHAYIETVEPAQA